MSKALDSFRNAIRIRPSTSTPFFRRWFGDERVREHREMAELHLRVSRQYAASRWGTGRDKAMGTVIRQLQACLPNNLAEDAREVFSDCYCEILTQEDYFFPPDDINLDTAVLSLTEGVELRTKLRRYEHFLANEHRYVEPVVETLVNAINGLVDKLPALPTSERALFTVPLYTLYPDINDILERVLGTFLREEEKTPELFRKLRRQLKVNLFAASGLAPDVREVKKPLRWPEDNDLPAEEAVRTYLGGTPFYNLFHLRVPLVVPERLFFEGTWIVAPPGRGKTTLLHAQFFEHLKEAQKGRASIILMDSKGDLIDPLRRIDYARLGLDDRVCIIDPDPEFPLALNPLDIGADRTDPLATYRAVILLEGLFSTLLDAKLTPLQSTLFHAVLTLLIEAVPNPTLATFRDILQNGYDKYLSHIASLHDDDVRNFFSKSQFDSSTYRETKQQVLWRLQIVNKNPVVKAMFNAPKTKVDMGRLMDQGSVVIINANKALLGEEGAEFFQRFFITLILSAAQQRAKLAPSEKTPVHLFIDECHTAISREAKIATILHECRSQKIAPLFAHQEMQQIKSPDVLGALSNCGIRLANSDDEASQLASRLRTTQTHLRSLPVGSFAAFFRDTTQNAVTVDVTRVDPASYPQLSKGDERRLRVAMRERYAREPVQKKPEVDGPAPDPSTVKPEQPPTSAWGDTV